MLCFEKFNFNFRMAVEGEVTMAMLVIEMAMAMVVTGVKAMEDREMGVMEVHAPMEANPIMLETGLL
jgi:hypothetical protein